MRGSDTETEQRRGRERHGGRGGHTCIMLPTSKVLIIFTFIKLITWAFKVSKTLVIKDQGGSREWGLVFGMQLSTPLYCYFRSFPFHLFSEAACSAIRAEAESGHSHCLHISLHHQREYSSSCCCLTLSILLSTLSRGHGDQDFSGHSLPKTPHPTKVLRRALKILQNWALLLLSFCLFCSGDTKLPARND